MKRSATLAAGAALALIVLASPARADVADNDPQLWITTKLLATMTDKIQLVSELEFRVGDGMGDMTRFHADIGLRVLLAKLPKLHVSADFAYRQAFWHAYFFDTPVSTSDVDQTWVAEYRPQAALTLTVPLGAFTLANTVRLDLRFFQENVSDEVRFNEILVAAVDIHAKSGYTFRLFTAVGISALFHPDPEYTRTRVYAGLMFPMGPSLTFSAYYMWQRFRVEPGWWAWHLGWTVNDDSWWDHHILGMSLTVNIGKAEKKTVKED